MKKKELQAKLNEARKEGYDQGKGENLKEAMEALKLQREMVMSRLEKLLFGDIDMERLEQGR